MIQKKQDILVAIRKNHKQIRALGVKRLGVFGSFARDEPGPESDVDLLIEFEKGGKSFDNFIQLSFLLEEIFQRSVELVTPESLSPYIGPHILKEVEYVALTP